MSGIKQTLVIVAGIAVLVVSIAVAGWMLMTATVVASTGTLSGGWRTIEIVVAVTLAVGIGLALLLFWIAMRKPKPR